MVQYGVDTNRLIRYILRDDSGQVEKAAGFGESNCLEDRPGDFNLLVC